MWLSIAVGPGRPRTDSSSHITPPPLSHLLLALRLHHKLHGAVCAGEDRRCHRHLGPRCVAAKDIFGKSVERLHAGTGWVDALTAAAAVSIAAVGTAAAREGVHVVQTCLRHQEGLVLPHLKLGGTPAA